MTREVIVVQTGQCGNQIGTKFWDVALQAHAKHRTSSSTCFDRGMNVLFRNVDYKSGYPLQVGSQVSCLKARVVLVDMESGVINPILRSPLGELYSQPQIITDVSGSGNNWATGYMEYGNVHGDDITNAIRIQLECCDCVDSVVFLQSLSGGTGSGLGSYIVGRVADEFSGVNRIVVPVFPSGTDDVVTAPYNSVLALNTLADDANVVLVVDNESLFKHYNLLNSQALQETNQRPNPFDAANTVVAEMIQELTTSLKFGGDSVFFPSHTDSLTCGKEKFLAPVLYMGGDKTFQRQAISFEKAITSKYDEKLSLCRAWRDCPADHSGLIYWGNISLAKVLQTAIKTSTSDITLFGHTKNERNGLSNPEGFLKLSRNASMFTVFHDIRRKFLKFYKRKAHLHHYLPHIEESQLEEASENLRILSDTYRYRCGAPGTSIPQTRRKPR